MSIDALVFSRDRPMQLDACVRSLLANVPSLGVVVAICKATEEPYWKGYEILAGELRDVAVIVPESDFQADAIGTLAGMRTELVLPLCDDSITFGLALIPEYALWRADTISLCLRLGRNTTYCHPRDLEHGLPQFEGRGPFLVWSWRGAPDGDLFMWEGKEGDFGYPYSLDGNIHRRESLLGWLDGQSFSNPNQMEGCVVNAIGRREDLPPLMACYRHSRQVGLPVNVVNQTHGNRFGLLHPVETGELNERFLAGQRIDWRAMDFTAVRGAHQELPLRFSS